MSRSLSQFSFPCPTAEMFGRIIFLDWYDGFVSGLAECFLGVSVVRFDLLAWGPLQERRIFAVSSLRSSEFSHAAQLLAVLGSAEWPRWFPRWSSDQDEQSRLNRDLEEILNGSELPAYCIETDRMFETVFAGRELGGVPDHMLPERIDAYPQSDNFDFWHSFVDGASR